MSDPGAVREENQDSLLSRPDLGLWVVADGAGGHQSGAMASGIIVEQLNRIAGDLPLSKMVELVRQTVGGAHAQLRSAAQAQIRGVVIASTFVALLLKDDQFACLWAGDSRLYRLRQGQLRQITKDHSLVQELIDLGKLTPAQAEQHPHANVITRAVGAEDGLELDQVGGMAAAGDRFLLCSDGLTKALSLEEITSLTGSADAIPPSQRLIDAARARYARDNVTAIVVEIPHA